MLVCEGVLTEVLQAEATREPTGPRSAASDRTISLADGERQTRYASLVHESLRGLLEVTGIDLAENKVHALAYALFGYFRDNPQLFPGWQGF